MEQKFRSYSFWMAVCGAVILVVNNIGKAFGFSVSTELVTNIVDSVCGVLVVFGVLTMPKKEKQNAKSDDDLKNDVNNDDLKNNVNNDDLQNDALKKSDSVADQLTKIDTKQKK